MTGRPWYDNYLLALVSLSATTADETNMTFLGGQGNQMPGRGMILCRQSRQMSS